MRNGIFCFVLAVIFAASSARATFTVIYSDFGKSDSYNLSAGWNVGTSSDFGIGANFKPIANALLGDITLGLGWKAGPNSFNIALTTDAGGLPSTGAPIETWSNVKAPNFGGSDLLELTPATNPKLTAGTTYWITISSSAKTSAIWNWNTIGAEDPAISFNNGASWTFDYFNTSPVFEVDSKFVPTPAALPGSLILMA
jgi:hypothetical protein